MNLSTELPHNVAHGFSQSERDVEEKASIVEDILLLQPNIGSDRTILSLFCRCGDQSPNSSGKCTKVEQILSSKIRIQIQTVGWRACGLNTTLHSVSYHNAQNVTQMMRMVLLMV